MAVEGFGHLDREAAFAHSLRPHEQIRVRDAPGGEMRLKESLRHLLPYDLIPCHGVISVRGRTERVT